MFSHTVSSGMVAWEVILVPRNGVARAAVVSRIVGGRPTHVTAVGDYNDWAVRRYVQQAAMALGVKVPRSLWHGNRAASLDNTAKEG